MVERKVETSPSTNRRDFLKRAGALIVPLALGGASIRNSPEKYPEDKWPEGLGQVGIGQEFLGEPSKEELRLAYEQFVPEIAKFIEEGTTTLAKEEIGPLASDPTYLFEALESIQDDSEAFGLLYDISYNDTKQQSLVLSIPSLRDQDGRSLNISASFALTGRLDSEINTGARTPELNTVGFGYAKKVPHNIINFNAPDYNGPAMQLQRNAKARFNLPKEAWDEALEHRYRQYVRLKGRPDETRHAEIHANGKDEAGDNYYLDSELVIPSNQSDSATQYYSYGKTFLSKE